MNTAAGQSNYLRREESFMYDREGRFRMEDTMNSGRLEYTEKGMSHMASRRCDIIRISQSGAVISLLTQFNLPKQFYLDIPDARINKVGGLLMKTFPNNTAEIRFLRLLTQKELDRIFVFSTHPAHRDRVLDVRTW
ncbi:MULTISPECIES: hypothetical protein [Rhizobium/Agrobacterium group]|uniref:PilZ domain-containing protein n=2 Tax=Rhizobium/Agrobacterium group TaxID=227290 RepID=B9JRT5_ALLAM|nr:MULTISPECIES: hypothetical protein [Rhizobium/Agrobacterium group]ACM35561.1 conserved hypothetical protein [Allorhizobium ampelinum S4]MBF2717131.1 hypothetical protein [Agrobacterium vitis]NSX95011.1 hypothetical protein [Agrobacterium vitis]NSZ15740.1 hypothetical protein [Agrobacterium vitis]NSZ26151.1 hypothetical protein [Agrobacterium vitis]